MLSLVSNIDQRLDQNVLRDLLSQYDMIDYGIPKCTHTHSKKSLAVASIVIFFEKQSKTTKIQSLPFLLEGRPDMLSMDMDSQG